jgi:outer membrane protein assembly factor BamB
MTKYSAGFKSFIMLALFHILFFQINNKSVKAFSTKFKNQKGFDWQLPLSLCKSFEFNKIDDPLLFAASDNEDSFILINNSNKIISLRTKDFKLLWSLDLGLNISSNIQNDVRSLYLIVEDKYKNYFLRRINISAGLPEWEIKINYPSKPNLVSMDKIHLKIINDEILVFNNVGIIFSIDKENGKVIWIKDLKNPLSSTPILNKNNIYISTVENTITKFSISNYKEPGLIKITKSLPNTLLVTTDGALVYGDKIGNVYSLYDSNTKIMWKVRLGAEIKDITQTRLGLLISSSDNFTYLIDNKRGKRLWKSRMSGSTIQKPLIVGDYFISTSPFQPEAIIKNLRNGKIINRVELEGDNFFTGDIIFKRDLLIFTTKKGIMSFSNNKDNCQKTN